MRSLFLKFLVSFWLVIGLIIGAAAVGGFLYAEQLQEVIEDFETGNSMFEANSALQDSGRAGLIRWREGTPPDDGVIIFFLDERGQDISFNRIPFAVERVFERHRARHERIQRDRFDGDRRLRRSRLLPQLTSPDGEILTMLVAPVRAPEAFWSSQDIRVLLFLFALLTSGLVSYALALAFSRPVRKLRDATVELAGGNLDVRVAKSIGQRRDELGMLGQDFDSMAEELKRAAERQTELSRNISHELRSPLARMRVAVALAKRKAGTLPEFERLEQDAERLDSLIGQILSYTRMEAHDEKARQSFDLNDVLNEVAENVNFEYGENTVSLPEMGDEKIIFGYREAITSAIENVIRNAARHSPNDVKVEVNTTESAGNIILEVVDAGPGVPDEDLSKLFEPFFRTQESADQDDNGSTGLGLAIARRAVQLHRGQIDAHNADDHGFVVSITLPLD